MEYSSKKMEIFQVKEEEKEIFDRERFTDGVLYDVMKEGHRK